MNDEEAALHKALRDRDWLGCMITSAHLCNFNVLDVYSPEQPGQQPDNYEIKGIMFAQTEEAMNKMTTSYLNEIGDLEEVQ